MLWLHNLVVSSKFRSSDDAEDDRLESLVLGSSGVQNLAVMTFPRMGNPVSKDHERECS